jgi:glycyl-tRNA synthetase beta chain
MFGELLLEIGTEEIPSDYLDKGLEELKSLAETCLRDNRIEIKEEITAYGTPRRLVLVGRAVADKQEDTVQEMTGPPKRAAFDEQGNPTKAALGFAQRHGVSVDDLGIIETPKGDYVHVSRKLAGKPTKEILSDVMPQLIASMPWPKSMRWGSGAFSFVRPIHWVLALYNDEIIPFEVAGVTSGNRTQGHRFMAPQPAEIHGLEDYLRKTKELFVVINQNERQAEIEGAAESAVQKISGTILKDHELLSTVTNMVEFPSAVCGNFDKEFLELPDPVLITAMKKHQRYFSVRDSDGRLMPNFVAINNTVARDESIVTEGHERVLRARLADATFFFKEDRKRPLEDRLEDLKKVVYHAQLGTSFAKVERFTRLAEYLAEKAAPEKTDEVRLAARLCKCDLVTEMVMEFPTLQGVIGEIYARFDGHAEDVCRAISDHYLPTQADSKLPESLVGSLVGLADRMDTIVGFFAIDLEPTGTADPFALRRQTLAIIRIMRDKNITMSIPDFVGKSASILSESVSFDSAQVIERVLAFIKERFRNMLLSENIPHDLIDAVITSDFSMLHQVEKRIAALQGFRDQSEFFEPLTTAYKRIVNILKDFEGSREVVPELFEDKSEEDLWKEFTDVKDKAVRQIEGENYFEALSVMAALSGPIDEFFSQVMVMAEDRSVRENRFAMLMNLRDLFIRTADFSKFST